MFFIPIINLLIRFNLILSLKTYIKNESVFFYQIILENLIDISYTQK